MLAIGVLLYAPIMLRFYSLLLHPREIYIQTRSGYGPLAFGSGAFLNLAFVLYLFKRNKSRAGAVLFFLLCGVTIFFHGSKGLLINLISMTLLYWVYVRGARVGLLRAAGITVVFATALLSLFALFAACGGSC